MARREPVLEGADAAASCWRRKAAGGDPAEADGGWPRAAQAVLDRPVQGMPLMTHSCLHPMQTIGDTLSGSFRFRLPSSGRERPGRTRMREPLGTPVWILGEAALDGFRWLGLGMEW